MFLVATSPMTTTSSTEPPAIVDPNALPDSNPYAAGRPWSWRPGPDDPEFDDPGWRAVRFIETHCRHTKGRWKGVRFVLAPFQLVDVLRVFGTVNAEGLRVIRTYYDELARKNGKSELAAAVALKLLVADGEESAEVYGAAKDRDQAGLVYAVAADMVRLDPALSKRVRIIESRKRLVVPKTSSFYVAIPADAAGSHGFNASGVVFDEIHTQPSRELWDVLTTSVGTRDQPLTWSMSTAGERKSGLCWELHDYTLKVLAGVIEDESWFGRIHSVPEDVDWRDERYWFFANPGLGTREEIARGEAFRSIEEMRSLALKAEHMPTLRATFRRLYLNQWVSSESGWIALHAWDTCGGLVLESKLQGDRCFGGLDLSSTSDFTAWVLVFPPTKKRRTWDVLARFWIPRVALERRNDDVRRAIEEWAAAGFVTITDGDVVDYDAIERQVMKDAQAFELVEFAFDPWNSTQTIGHLLDEGIEAIEMRQTIASLNGPTKLVETLVGDRLLNHGGNPVLRWMIDNCVVQTDSDGNYKPSRKKSTEKIDGLIALVMALGVATRPREESPPMIYVFD